MATTTEQVRLLTALTTAELSDEQIGTWLELAGDDPHLAAADALEAYASTLATVSVSSDDISLDGSKRAAVLMQRADRLRAQAAEGGLVFDVIDASWPRPELTEPDVSGWC